MEPITKAKMYEMLNHFAESLPDEGEGPDMTGDMSEGEAMGKPPGGVEISVESKPEGMGGKTCPTCGQAC